MHVPSINKFLFLNQCQIARKNVKECIFPSGTLTPKIHFMCLTNSSTFNISSPFCSYHSSCMSSTSRSSSFNLSLPNSSNLSQLSIAPSHDNSSISAICSQSLNNSQILHAVLPYNVNQRGYHTCSFHLSRKFEKIKGKKLVSDVRKTVIVSKISREIQAAVSASKSADPEVNSRLKLALDNAKKNFVPKAVIDKAIKNGLEDKATDTMEIIWYAGRVSRVCIIVRALADRTKRQVTTNYLKHIFTSNGGTVGDPKSVEFAFKRKGMFVFPKDSDFDKIMDDCIETNVEDIFVNYEGNIVALCNPNEYFTVKNQLEEIGYNEFQENDIVMYPIEESLEEVQVGSELGNQLSELLESLEEHEDVQEIFSNIRWIPAEE